MPSQQTAFDAVKASIAKREKEWKGHYAKRRPDNIPADARAYIAGVEGGTPPTLEDVERYDSYMFNLARLEWEVLISETTPFNVPPFVDIPDDPTKRRRIHALQYANLRLFERQEAMTDAYAKNNADPSLPPSFIKSRSLPPGAACEAAKNEAAIETQAYFAQSYYQFLVENGIRCASYECPTVRALTQRVDIWRITQNAPPPAPEPKVVPPPLPEPTPAPAPAAAPTTNIAQVLSPQDIHRLAEYFSNQEIDDFAYKLQNDFRKANIALPQPVHDYLHAPSFHDKGKARPACKQFMYEFYATEIYNNQLRYLPMLSAMHDYDRTKQFSKDLWGFAINNAIHTVGKLIRR